MAEEPNHPLWWEQLSPGSDNPLHIIVRLPHGEDPKAENPPHKALVIAKNSFYESGDDHSFVFIQCQASVSRARLVDVVKEAGLEPVALTSKSDDVDLRSHLMEVKGYCDQNDPALGFITAKLEQGAQAWAVGGYPVPPVYNKTIRPKGVEIPNAPADDEDK
jgi:rhodanese-related sulfurtransferase